MYGLRRPGRTVGAFGPGWFAALIAILFVALLTVHTAAAQQGAPDSTQARSQITEAYAAVLQAEQSGGNVTSLVVQLNSAISLVHQADQINQTDPTRAFSLYGQANNITSLVLQEAPGVASAGRAAALNAKILLAVETAALGAVAVLAYFYGPRLFWRAWARAHRGWRVRKR